MKDSLLVERCWPWVLALCCAAASYRVSLSITSAIGKELLAAVLSAASICAGFLTTALTVLMALGSTEIGRRLRAAQQLGDLFSYLRTAIISCLVTSLLCMIGFFFFNKGDAIPAVPTSVFTGVTIFAGACIWRIIPILLSIMEHLSQPEDKQG